jgi:cadmium resistance protein CadD (predicted permease)
MGIGFLGLIPIGVGLAYLIFYRVESKKLLS